MGRFWKSNAPTRCQRVPKPQLLKNQRTGRGVSIDLYGIDGLMERLAQYPEKQMAAFREAAKAVGVLVRNQARNNLAAQTGRKRTINVRDMTDKAREDIAKGTIKVQEKLTRQEGIDEQTRILMERQRQGKSGKVKRPTHKVRPVRIAKFISAAGNAQVYGSTGNLKKSIQYKLWSPKAKAIKIGKKFKRQASGIVKLMVGPTRIQGAAYNEFAGRMQKFNTFNYYHLVEKGHRKVVMGKRLRGRVPAYPFLEPAAKSMRMRASAMARSILARHLSAARLKYTSQSGVAA